jgi:hypothetical protein
MGRSSLRGSTDLTLGAGNGAAHHFTGANMRKVSLQWVDVEIAAQVGMLRHLEAMKRKYEPGQKADKEKLWDSHISGAIGERAFASVMRLAWDASVNTFRGLGDVYGVEVRTRPPGKFYQLYVTPNDNPDRYFVLMRGYGVDFTAVGYYLGSAAQEQGSWLREMAKGRPKNYLVPNELLKTDWDWLAHHMQENHESRRQLYERIEL